MSVRMLVYILAAAMAGTLAGCDDRDLSGPPSIRLGRDECVKCGMSIVEDRCSCALLVLEHGQLEHRLFDDIGDMLDYERTTPDLVVKDRFVHDYDTRAWASAATATYVHAEDVHTPMASGLVAFAMADAARAFAEKHSGKVMGWEEAGKFRVAWRVERYGK